MKRCILCGAMFEPKTNAQRICNNKHYRKCKVCGSEFEISRPSDSKQCCSRKCTAKLREHTMMSRYGVAHALESKEFLDKSEATQLELYGVKHAAQNEDVKRRVAEAFTAKYGVPTPFLMDDFQEKSTRTCLERYGVKYTSQIPGRTDKMKQTNLARYGSEYPLGNDDISEKVRQNMIDRYGVPYYCMTEDCRSKQKQVISSFNRQVMAKLQDAGISSVPEAVTIDCYSYDIFIPSLNTVIEVNPTDTHNAIKNPWSDRGLPKNYHLDKTRLAREHGYRCINIWDWDSVDKIVNMLSPKSPVYARKCRLQEIDNKTVEKFENMYHLQGQVKGQQVCLGLYYQQKLIQVMTFGKPRYNTKFEWELLRLCSDNRYAVVGGAERLWRYFILKYCPASVISYCDVSKFSGSVYERLGMVLDECTAPNKIWSKGREMITNNLLLQRGYDQIFKTRYGKGTSNEELMIANGWLPVYDCGQARYVYHKL